MLDARSFYKEKMISKQGSRKKEEIWKQGTLTETKMIETEATKA